MQLGAWTFGEGALDLSGPALSNHKNVSMAGNFFGARLVIELQHPLPWETYPTKMLLHARELQDHWVLCLTWCIRVKPDLGYCPAKKRNMLELTWRLMFFRYFAAVLSVCFSWCISNAFLLEVWLHNLLYLLSVWD